MKIVNLSLNNQPLEGFKLGIANTLWLRFRGLLGRPICDKFGLLIMPCKSIHTMWMKYAIDVVFIDKHGNVTAVYEDIKPWRTASEFSAHSVLELKAGNAEKLNIKKGSFLSW